MAGFDLPEEIAELRDTAARLAREGLAPAARRREREGRWPEDVLDVLTGLALGALDVPEDRGGVGAGCTAKVAVLEELAWGDAGGLPAADRPGPWVGALVACPDRDLAAAIAAAALAGDAHGALLVMDADGGDATTVPWAPAWPPLRWVWTSRGDLLRLHDVPAAVADAGALAFHASGGATADLDAAPLVGEWQLAPGAGVELRGRARLWAAAVALGVAQSALDATIGYTTERVVFGRPVAHHQGNAFQLAALATELHGARLAVHDAAAGYDEADPHSGFWATQAWMAAMETAVAITDAGIQLLGGHGFLLDHLAEKRFREARMLGLLAGGTDAAEADLAALVLDVPDPFSSGVPEP